MKLSTALRLGDLPCLAVVGAGGKSSALFCLANELTEAHRTVIITTTTHLGAWQVRAADKHLVLSEGEVLDEPLDHLHGIVIATAPVHNERAGSLDEAVLEQLYQLAVRARIPLLIEADGARGLPLKAPGEHEPVIPGFTRQVLVCAGLSGLGKPLTGEWVHRPQRFAQLSGTGVGELITTEAVSRVLIHLQGGLKSIPPEAQRILLLNQADTELQRAQANAITLQCMQAFHQVVISAFLISPGEEEPALSRMSQPANIFAVHEAIAGVILAAGGATRYGTLKQVQPWKGIPLVRHAALAALQAGLSPVVLVTGSGSEQVAQAVDGLPVRVVGNPDWQSGQSTSLRAGLMALPPTCGGALFLLADQPNVSAVLIRTLVEAHSQSLAPITAPLVDGQRSNPVLFDRLTFIDLQQVTGDQGGRQLFARYPIQYVPWLEREVLLDVDTPDDFNRLQGGTSPDQDTMAQEK